MRPSDESEGNNSDVRRMGRGSMPGSVSERTAQSQYRCLRACLKMGRGSAAGEFWVGQGGERRGRPPAVCSARTNAVQAGKTRRPEGLGGKGPLAALLVGHRPLRVCFLLAPCQSNPSLPNRTPPHFQTGSYPLSLLSDRRLGPAELRPRYPVKNPWSLPCNFNQELAVAAGSVRWLLLATIL